jgi:hypothetical protein
MIQIIWGHSRDFPSSWASKASIATKHRAACKISVAAGRWSFAELHDVWLELKPCVPKCLEIHRYGAKSL